MPIGDPPPPHEVVRPGLSMTAPTPTDAEMVAWLEQQAKDTDVVETSARAEGFGDPELMAQDAAMLRAIAARLRERAP